MTKKTKSPNHIPSLKNWGGVRSIQSKLKRSNTLIHNREAVAYELLCMANTKITDDDSFNSLNESVYQNLDIIATQSANTSYNVIQEQTSTSGDQVAQGGEQFKVGTKEMINISGLVLSNSFTNIFGKDNGFKLFLTALIGFITFVMGLYIYKAWWGRNPD